MNTKLILISAFSLLAISSINTAYAGGDIEAGKEKAVLCAACHGIDGNGTDPSYPKLAGQHQSYLSKALQDYKSGDRKNPIMAGMVAAINAADIENLAAYYASLDGLQDLSSFKQ